MWRWPPTPSAWASTARTSGSSRTSRCPAAWRRTIRKRAARAATASRRSASCTSTTPTRACRISSSKAAIRAAPVIQEIYRRLAQCRRRSGRGRRCRSATIAERLTTEGAANNDMAVSAALSILHRADYIDRFDLPGQRTRGTRITHPNVKPARTATRLGCAGGKGAARPFQAQDDGGVRLRARVPAADAAALLRRTGA